uniref:Zn(2)-C6 fungal-type domain-containing protein n=1 Tax=Psilocybe cubensis TaxID=181762 RepID=A0A8H8CMA0_PSICU
MQHDIHYPNQQQGLVLPTPSMQNQIHELAKTLPPPRKQNTACDACRARKVKCNRLPGQDKCQHCLSKNYACTHFVQQATSEKKRSSATSRRPRNLSSAGANSSTHTPPKYASPGPDAPSSPSTMTQQNQPLMVRYGFFPPLTLSTPTHDVLKFVFAPPDQPGSSMSSSPSQGGSKYDIWGDMAFKLEDAKFRSEFALDLVEVFFQIVHTRLPLLNPEQFRTRLQLQGSAVSSNTPPLHPALVATVLAWGTKFSEHPLLVADRRRPGGQSLLAKTLIDRARDLAEALKVHRIPSSDHVVISLLLEPLQNQNPEDPLGFHGFWLTSATRHLLDLGINHKSVMANIQDPESRGTMIFAWWMTCISDAYASAYYRRKPVLDDDDYDIDFYTVDPVNMEVSDGQAPMPSPREQLEFLGYYRAAHSLARTARQMSRQLWRPATDSDGISFENLCTFAKALTEWREEYLNLVGVPSNFEGEWDFVSAVSSCASDATYHVMWIILFNALDDFGIKELNAGGNLPHNHAAIDDVKRKVADEALHGALRIAGLAGVLTSNGYLRLDPAVMHISCILAGTLLARLGRPEVANCIAGLKQYSYAYEEAGDQANEMNRLFNRVRMGEQELHHMASVAPRVGGSPPSSSSPHSHHGHGMMVDDTTHLRTNGSSSHVRK